MKIKHALRYSLVLAMAGCMAPSHTSTSAFLQTPSAVHFRQPLAIQVEEMEPDLDALVRSSGFYRSIQVSPKGRLAALFANDLQRILEKKRMAKPTCVIGSTQAAPPDFALIRIRLHTWFGRVPNPPATARATSWLLGSPTVFAEGRCEFDAELWQNQTLFSLGRHSASVRVPTDGSSTMAEEGRLASAQAADQAIASLLVRLGKHLRAGAATPDWSE